ncbi:MAG: class I tRNA ligase family protein [Anaerolineae bacterium]|nr:class I tRNA ligase family protein [Anaerolineae bacterium]
MRLHDSLTQSLQPLPSPGRPLRLYVCGITPYDTTHLGHAFTYCSYDVLIRFLEWQGVPVRYVQNVTDVDNDILGEARARGEDWRALGNRWVRRFIDDMIALNVRPPDVYPRATTAIPEIIRAVEVLLSEGHAYAREDWVYYRAQHAPLGCLSHLPPQEWLRVAAERGNDPNDPRKEAPLDWVLWQASGEGEPTWPSPWGPGRPGWHIECSALANLHLGACIDLHGGGTDLSFPHHEAEIAQSEAYTGCRPFARLWVHTAMVCLDGVKMSKSLGNLVMVSDLLERYSADALRLYLGSHHYRQGWSHDEGLLAERARQAAAWQRAAAAGGQVPASSVEACERRFRAALENDLDTPRAIEVLHSLAGQLLSARRSGPDGAGAATLVRLAGILGLRLGAPGPDPRAIAGWRAHRKQFE